MILIISLKPLLRWRIWKPSGQEHWEKFRDEEYSIWYWYNHLQRNKTKDEPWRLLQFFVRGMYSFSQRLWSGKRNFMNQWERNSLRKTAKVRPKDSYVDAQISELLSFQNALIQKLYFWLLIWRYCQARVQVQGLSQISKSPGPGAWLYNCNATHHPPNFSEQNNIEISSSMNWSVIWDPSGGGRRS